MTRDQPASLSACSLTPSLSRAWRPNWPVTSEGEQAGVLLDYTYSRIFGRYIARALVSASIEVGQTITIHHPGGDADGEVTVIPFPDSGTAKA